MLKASGRIIIRLQESDGGEFNQDPWGYDCRF